MAFASEDGGIQLPPGLQEILDHAPSLVYAKDRAGRYVLGNRAFFQATRRSPEETLGHTDHELFADQFADAYADHDRRVLETGETLQFEEAGPLTDQARRFLSLKFPLRTPEGEIYAVCGISTDITERVRAETALQASEERFRLAERASGNLVYDWDVAGGFLTWSESLQTIFGYPSDQRVTSIDWWSAVTHPDDAERVGASLQRALEGDAELWTEEYRFRRADGSYAQVLDRGYIVRDPAGAAVRMVGSMIDVTAQRAHESQLRRAERLAGLGTLVGGVAHELNNPLAAIKSFAQLMLMDPRPPEDREALEVMQREADRAARIVADLRRATRESQRTDVVREPVDLNDVVLHVLRVRDYALRTHDVEVDTVLAPELPPVLGSRAELEQVLVNLVVNAEQAMAPTAAPKQLQLATRRTAQGVVVTVSDSGTGIAADDLPRVFDPFFTTKEPGEGTGLGLSLAYSIAAAHGGDLAAESEPGRGATFHLRLPAIPAPPPSSRRARAATPAARSLHVLVVDDETSIRRAVGRFLERRGHRVAEAGDGAEALALLADAGPHGYDVILSDLRMPGFSGEQLVEQLRREDPSLAARVIFMTGDAATLDAHEVLSRLAIPVVLKPFEMDELIRRVEETGKK